MGFLTLLVLLIIAGSVLGIIAFILVLSNQSTIRSLERRLSQLQKKLNVLVSGEEIPTPREKSPVERQTVPQQDVETDGTAATQEEKSAMSGEPGAEPELTPGEQEPETTEEPQAEPVSGPMEEAEVAEEEPQWGEPEQTEVEPAETTAGGWDNIEWAIGKLWVARIGAFILFLAAGLFVKYAIDMGWLGPAERCVLGLIGGVAMLVAGQISIGKEMRGLGQALMGGALAVLYVSLFAAFSLYDLIPQQVAFLSMVGVTALGMALAMRNDAITIAFLALIGGLLTPVLCSTGTNQRDVLFTYLTVLNLGMLGVILLKKWRGLDLVALAGTWLLFAGWYVEFYSGNVLTGTLAWLLGFFVLFLILPLVCHLRGRNPLPMDRFIVETVIPFVVTGYLLAMLYESYQNTLALVFFALGAVYTLGTIGWNWWVSEDRKTRLLFVILAVGFVTWGVLLEFGYYKIPVLWSIEAMVLLCLGLRLRYEPLRVLALTVFGIAVLRVLLIHLPSDEEFATLFLNREFGAMLSVPFAGAICAFLSKQFAPSESKMDDALKLIWGITSWLLAVFVIQVEITSHLYDSAPEASAYYARCSIILVWTFGAFGLLIAGKGLHAVAGWVGVLPLLLACILSGSLYSQEIVSPHTVGFNLRFITAIIPVALLFSYGFWRSSTHEDVVESGAAVFHWCGWLYLIVILSAEPAAYCWETISDLSRAQWMARMSVSVVWAISATVTLVVGFWRKWRTVRLGALGLFGATAIKLVAMDLSGIEQIYRIISFVVLGVLMVLASYLYHRAEKLLTEINNDSERSSE